MDKSSLLKILGSQYTIELIDAVKVQGRRFSDFRGIVPNDRTLTVRLRELLDAEIFTVESKIIDKKPVTHYILTAKGKKIRSIAEELENMS